jgi:hypothetical protein
VVAGLGAVTGFAAAAGLDVGGLSAGGSEPEPLLSDERLREGNGGAGRADDVELVL